MGFTAVSGHLEGCFVILAESAYKWVDNSTTLTDILGLADMDIPNSQKYRW